MWITLFTIVSALAVCLSVAAVVMQSADERESAHG
jgi:hypothetical protein